VHEKQLETKVCLSVFNFLERFSSTYVRSQATNHSTTRYDRWAILDTPKYQSEFQSLIDFAQAWFGKQSLKFLIKYNFIESRIEFHVFDNLVKLGLQITFMHGYPIYSNINKSSFITLIYPKSVVEEDYWDQLPQ
jgi:hypothetical protein